MSCQIIINGDIRIKGLGGTKRWFLNQESHCYTRKVRLLVSCESCGKRSSTRMQWFYQVVIDNEIFRIPFTNAVEVTRFPENNNVLWGNGTEEEYRNKRIYEDVNKDEDYPSNGDYKGYIKGKTGFVQPVGPQYSGDAWYNEMMKSLPRQKGIADETEEV